jgi:hypothetical protein
MALSYAGKRLHEIANGRVLVNTGRVQTSRLSDFPEDMTYAREPGYEKKESPMQRHTCILSALTAMFFGISAMAADLPKQGTYSGTLSGFGTTKATQIGKERLLMVYDLNALDLTNGLLDHFTWHCFGLVDTTNGMTQYRGYCVGTDPAGDQVVGDDVSDGKYPQDAKSFSGMLTLTTGTGKYAGISGSQKYICHLPDFRPATVGTFFQYCTQSGNYKLP